MSGWPYRPVALALLVSILAGCTAERNVFAPVCPVAGLVKPLTELVRYRGGSQDAGDLIIRARIVDVGGKCRPGRTGIVIATAQVTIDVTRGPAMEGLSYELPLFVAVTDSNAVRDKTLYSLTVEFSRTVDKARAMSPDVEMELPVTPQKSAAAYGIIAGFQLTPGEVDAYRRNARR